MLCTHTKNVKTHKKYNLKKKIRNEINEINLKITSFF